MSESTPEVSSSYPPPAHFAEHANARAELYREAEEDRLAFWAKQANRLSWTTPFTEVLDWSGAPFAKWFVGGELNVAYNCVDRHVEAGHGDRVAIHWEGEPVGDRRTLTYSDLLAEVSKAANALTDLGLVAGDRVAIYLPLIPEAVIAMLACARLGIMHSVVFGGFTAAALQARIVDAQAKLLITADGQFRRGKPSPLKAAADEALAAIPDCSVEHVLVVRRTGIEMAWSEGRDLWWHHVVGSASPAHTPEPFDSEHPLFLLYTSGTTGKPKGIMHTSGGYLTQLLHDAHHFRCQAGQRRVLVHRRHRLGHRPHLRRLRPAVQRSHRGSLRGHAGYPRPTPAFPDHRKIRRDNLLHRPHPHPDVYEVGP